jgi:hypothetical protein
LDVVLRGADELRPSVEVQPTAEGLHVLHAPTRTVPCLDHHDALPRGAQLARSSQAGEPGTDDDAGVDESRSRERGGVGGLGVEGGGGADGPDGHGSSQDGTAGEGHARKLVELNDQRGY